MITAVVTFKLPPEMSREKWQENIKQASARFQNVPGLIRKQFLYNDKGVGGGVYLWETREAAENCYYKSPWAENVRKASGGNEPEIAWFETGVVVDNENHQIKLGPKSSQRRRLTDRLMKQCMSPLGQKQTSRIAIAMSALPPESGHCV